MKTKTVYELKSNDELMNILQNKDAVYYAKKCFDFNPLYVEERLLNKIGYHLETRVKSKDDILETLKDYDVYICYYEHKYKPTFYEDMFDFCGKVPDECLIWDSAWLEEVWIKDGEG